MTLFDQISLSVLYQFSRVKGGGGFDFKDISKKIPTRQKLISRKKKKGKNMNIKIFKTFT